MAQQTQTAMNALTQQILQNDPEIKALVRQRLDSQIEEHRVNLEAATAERAQLDAEGTIDGVVTDVPAPKKRGRKPGQKNGTGRKPGRPAGSGAKRSPGRPSGGESPHHAERITEALTKTPGMGLTDIVAAMVKKYGDPEDAAAYKKTISTYLSKMSSVGRLTTKGERPNVQYFVGKNKKS